MPLGEAEGLVGEFQVASLGAVSSEQIAGRTKSGTRDTLAVAPSLERAHRTVLDPD